MRRGGVNERECRRGWKEVGREFVEGKVGGEGSVEERGSCWKIVKRLVRSLWKEKRRGKGFIEEKGRGGVSGKGGIVSQSSK